MKSFLAASAFFVLALALSAAIYSIADTSTTSAFSTESARVDHHAPRDGRLGWARANDG